MIDNNSTAENLLRVKQNIAKMVKMNAPKQDIDTYIQEEGIDLGRIQRFPLPEEPTPISARVKKALPFETVRKIVGAPEYERGERSLLGDIFERPGAAVRSAILGRGYKKGALYPEEVPKFQDIGLEKYYDFVGKTAKEMTPLQAKAHTAIMSIPGLGVSATGLAADVLTNPANLLLLLVGKTPVGKGRTLGGIVSETTPVKATGRFLMKERHLPFNRVIKDVTNPASFGQDVRANLFEKHREVGDTFEEGIRDLSQANPKKAVDLSEPFYSIKEAIVDAENNPGLAREINAVLSRIKDPKQARFIRNLIQNPAKAKKLSLLQSQEIKNTIRQAPSIATKSAQGKFANWTGGEREMLDMVNDIRLAQSEAFPTIKEVREPYRKYITAYKEVKNMFKPKVLLNKIRDGFGNEEIDAMVKAVLPDEVLGRIRAFNRGETVKDIMTFKGIKTILKKGLLPK